MERRGEGIVGRLEGGNRDAERSEPIAEGSWFGEAEAFSRIEEQVDPGARGSRVTRGVTRGVTSWLNWQSALYLFVMGWVCVLLVPLTSFWWLTLAFATAAPVVLAILDRPGIELKNAEKRRVTEREILHALTETMSYALQQRDKDELPGEVPASLEKRAEDAGTPHLPGLSQNLDEPLSEREIEVLNVLASGRTNSEVARDLFISVGTIKSHTNNIYRKLGVTNRAGALARARSLDLLSS